MEKVHRSEPQLFQLLNSPKTDPFGTNILKVRVMAFLDQFVQADDIQLSKANLAGRATNRQGRADFYRLKLTTLI